jgi:hypothetical protein
MTLRKHNKIVVQTDSQKVYSGSRELLDSEEGLAGYNFDIVGKMVQKLGLEDVTEGAAPTLVEFGAGTGALAEVFRDSFNLEPICIEIDPVLIAVLQSKGFKTLSDVNGISTAIDFLYTSNVLEHIEDDVKALVMIREKMSDGGKIAIYVPALPILFSDLDRRVGHYRRYTKKELINNVQAAGLDVQSCYFNDSVGVLASLAIKILGYKNKTGLGSKNSVLFYDKYVYPVSKTLDRIIFRHLIGKNLFLFAIKPAE